MIPELGHFALIIALCIAIVQVVVPLVGAHRGIPAYTAVARPAAQAQFIFVAIAFGCLIYAFLTNDFSVVYASHQSNTLLPVEYKVAAVWGGHEGSLLLWLLMLSGWGLAVSLFSRNLPVEMVARVLSVMAMVAIGFLLFTLITSNPFERIFPAPADGQDLNPQLQDFGLIIHPPMLYMGYVGFSVAFSFAIAALISGKLDATWARWSRPWTTIAWVFLTFGVALGSWWAYYELGWGGWWFWDPVENASFMPWLVGTALVHSLAVTEKRGSFKNWTVLLAITTFSLSLLGTFLVRSGVLTSVHSFASDPERGAALLIFLSIVIGGSLLLFAWRASSVGLGGGFAWISRESMLLANNVILVCAAGAVLLGTLYPLVLDVLNQGKISVGPPYFDAVFVPLMAPLIFLMGVGPATRWKKASVPDLVSRLKWAFGIAVVTAVLVPLAMGKWTPMISMGVLMAAWIVSTIATSLVLRFRQRAAIGAESLGSASLSYYGMQLAHLGVAIFIVGVTLVNGYQEQKDVRVDVGDTVEIGDLIFRFDGVREIKGPNYVAEMGTVIVTEGEKLVATMHPEKRFYTVRQQAMTEAAIITSLGGDLYVSLGEQLENGAWTIRVYVKPFVDWVWGGAALMGLGGLLAISDKRYRLRRREKSAGPAVNSGSAVKTQGTAAGKAAEVGG